jgi:PAS domain S-box-containing protein
MNEELEASNEELRVLNEQLVAINEELHEKIRQLEQARDDMENFFTSTEITTVFLDGEFRIKRFTPSAEALLNLLPGDVDRPITDIRSRFGDADLLDGAEDVLAGGPPIQRHLRADDGAWYVQRTLAYRTSHDQIDGLVLTFTDITELRSGQARYRLLAESITDPFLGVDSQLRCTYWNAACEKLTGVRSDQALGRPIDQLLSLDPLSAVPGRLAEGIEKQEPLSFDCRMTAPGGERDLAVSAYPSPDGLVVFLRDVSDQKRAERERRAIERQMQQAQKLESLGVLAGGVAHDFNNILTSVLGNAELALMELSETSPAAESVNSIKSSAIRASELTKQMLAYSGRGSFVVHALDLNALVREMTHLMESAVTKRAGIELDLADGLPAVQADPTQLRQVLMNLMTNASEALGPEGGTIGLSTRAVECSSEDFQGALIDIHHEPGTYVCLEVCDNGCGMDEETLHRIFEPFFTTKFAGRGLGLAAMLGIVRGHRGAVYVDSRPGKGTTFRVLLPAMDQPVETKAEPSHDMHEWRGRGLVLVVDDEPAVRTTGRRLLERLGFSVTCAANGTEAIDVFRKRVDEVVCVLLDLTMPGLDGEQTMERLRQINESTPILISSGYSEREIQDRFEGKDLSGFVHKPYELNQLASALCEATESDRQ